jgi:adenylate cyclase class IV
MREVELKSVVADVDAARRAIERAGAKLDFAGRLEDRRFDTPDRSLAGRDHVLRLRIYRDGAGARAALDWKGPTMYEGGYKVRDEHSTDASDAMGLATILERLGFVVTREIDREIIQYRLDGAVVRFERYPRMDSLVEVEGAPDAIESAIAALGLERAGFSADRLPQFIARYEARTGERAAICDRELAGDYPFDPNDA